MADLNTALPLDTGYQQFKAIYRGFAYVGVALEPFTRHNLETLHQRISTKLAGTHPCQNQCSQRHGNRVHLWCKHCDVWRKELLANRANQQCNWKNTKSWEWSLHYEKILSVFLPSSWNGQVGIDIRDISTAVNIWRNCNEFNIDDIFLKRLQKLRNQLYGHNSGLKCTMIEKTQVFDTLKRLVNDPDIAVCALVNVPDILQNIEHIRILGDDTLACLQDIDRKLNELVANQPFGQAVNWIKKVLQNKTRCTTGILLAIMFAFMATYIGPTLFPMTENNTQGQDSTCLSENYTEPFSQDLPLFDYISGHVDFIGREWLFHELHTNLTNMAPLKRGIILFAEMGYGKSALVKQLICAEKTESGGLIQQHVIGYHVCRFDVASTRSPDVLIRRLVGFIATHSSEYRSSISSLGKSSIIYDRLRCREDPAACIDQGLSFPLKRITINDAPWLIIIDAFDECFGDDIVKISMFDILHLLLQKLPKSIKFLITSREKTLFRIQSKLSIRVLEQLESVFLISNDSRNKADVKKLVDMNREHHVGICAGIVSNGKNVGIVIGILSKGDESTLLSNVLNKSDSNFLITKHVIQYSKQNAISLKLLALPPTLEKIYQLDFDRLFDMSTEKFNSVKGILEILCATTEPLDAYTIFKIIAHNQELITNFEIFQRNVDMLSEYISRTTHAIIIRHFSIYHWLVSKYNKYYRVSLHEGHAQIARYGLQLLKANETVDVIDLAVHVNKSSNEAIAKAFKQCAKAYNRTLPISYLNNLIWTSDSMSNIVKLMLHFYANVDELNEGGVTPAFVAATKGHMDILNVLIKNGANISFVMDGADFVRSFDVFEKIKKIKSEYFWGYGILHIASQNGHDNVVRYVLDRNNHLVNVTNGVGMRAIDIACEYGHVNVVQMLKKYQSTYSKCLYYSSLNGHSTLIKHLLSQGVKHKCINTSYSARTFDYFFTSLSKLMNRAIEFRHPRHTTAEYEEINETYKADNTFILEDHVSKRYQPLRPLDIFWIALGYSPLHAATINGHADAASVLIEQFPKGLNCVDSLGRTPLFTSIIHKQVNVFNVFVKAKKSNKKCEPLAQHLKSDKMQFLVPQFDPEDCPVNSTISHLLALHGNNKMIVSARNTGIHIDCKQRNALSMSPLHYAAQSSNVDFANICTETINYEQLRRITTKEGLSIFHIAAYFGSFNFLKQIANGMPQIPQVTDHIYRSILHLTVSVRLSGRNQTTNALASKRSARVFKWLVEDQMHDLTHIDAYGRNIMHIALVNGHWGVVEYILQEYSEKAKYLLNQKSYGFETPISLSIGKLEWTLINICTPTFFWEFLDKATCSNVFTIMNPQELSLYMVLKYCYQNECHEKIFKNNVVTLIMKSESLTVAFLKKFKHLEIVFSQQILSTINSIPPLSLLSIAHYRPELLHECYTSSIMSPMRQIMKYGDKILFFLNSVQRNYIFNRVFGFRTKLDKYFFTCFDNKGFNLLHIALQYGNLRTVHYLLKRGMPISNDVISVQDFFQIGMFARLTEFHGNTYTVYTRGIKQNMKALEYLDYILSKQFRKVYTKITPSYVCNKDKRELSFIHYVAINGMITVLKNIERYFGSATLGCLNKDGISPLYLASMFNHEQVVLFLKSKSLYHQLKEDVEAHLIVRLMHGIPLRSVSDPYQCLVNPAVRLAAWNTRSLYKTQQCLLESVKEYTFSVRISIKVPVSSSGEIGELKLVPSAHDRKWNSVAILLRHMSTLNLCSVRTKSDICKLKTLKENIYSDFDVLANALIRVNDKNDVNLIKILYRSKKEISVQSWTFSTIFVIKRIIYHLLFEFRDRHIDDYILKHPTSLEGMQSRAFPTTHVFARIRKDAVREHLKNNAEIISRYIHTYNYMNLIRSTAGYTFIKRTIVPEDLQEQFKRTPRQVEFGGLKEPLKYIQNVRKVIRNPYDRFYDEN